MLENAKEVDTIAGRMAEAAAQQAKGTETVLSSTLEIEQMVEEAQRQSNNLKEGADSISEISNDLEEKMGFFKVR